MVYKKMLEKIFFFIALVTLSVNAEACSGTVGVDCLMHIVSMISKTPAFLFLLLPAC